MGMGYPAWLASILSVPLLSPSLDVTDIASAAPALVLGEKFPVSPSLLTHSSLFSPVPETIATVAISP